MAGNNQVLWVSILGPLTLHMKTSYPDMKGLTRVLIAINTLVVTHIRISV